MIGLGFSAPWVLAAAAALAIPILAHLARHEDRAGQGFPSLMFLRRVPFPARSRHRLEDRVLLALRALALLALVLAFAGPYPRHADGAHTTASDTVVLLDLSYSMGLGDRFERARSAARRALSEGGEDARVALLGFDRAPRALSTLADGRAAALAALAQAEPGVLGTDLSRALEAAWRMLAASDSPRRRVVLIGDLQARGLGADPRLPQDVEFEVRAVDGTIPANLAILQAWPESRAAADGRVTLRVRVANTGAQPGAATLRMVLDGLVAAEHALELAPGERRDVDLMLFPAAQRATKVHLHLDPGDALPVDDARFLVLAPPRALQVLLLRAHARSDGYLEAALALARDPPLRVEAVALPLLTRAPIERADAIVLDGVAVRDEALARALQARVAAGAGLLAFAGTDAMPASGAAPAPDALAMLPAAGALIDASAGGLYFGALAPEHALARALRDARVDGIAVWRHRTWQAAAEDTVLARYSDGAPALIERVHGAGRILAFTSSTARDWSDLAIDPAFVPLLLESLSYLTGTRAAPYAYAPGSVLDVAAHVPAAAHDGELARALAAGEAIGWRTPSGSMQRVRAHEPLRLDEVGFHELRTDAGDVLPVAVSVESAESLLEVLDAQALTARVRRYPQPDPPRVIDERPDEVDGALARALLMVAVGLLLTEGLLAARVTRRRALREAPA